MRLDDFNSAPPSAATTALRPCADVPRWVEDIAGARPFASTAHLLSYAATAAPGWTREELDGALRHHPRIGDRALGATPEAGLSRQEQAGLHPSADTAQQLIACNRDYEDKFGRVFLIRAAGRTAEDILANLRLRLEHSPEQELPVVADQLREIAILRLRGIFRS